MVRLKAAVAAVAERHFPEQVFAWHRVRGVSIFRVGSSTQVMALGGAALIAGWLGVAASSMSGGHDAEMVAKQAELDRLQRQVQVLKADTAQLYGNVATTAAKIEARQAFLAGLLGGKRDLAQLAAMLPRDASPAPADTALEPFRKVETAQLAFVDKATDAARARLQDTQSLIRRLGLDPNRFVAQSDVAFGTGGPLIPVGAPADADPRFKSLFVSWKKLAALETAMAAIPSFVPVKSYSTTSTYGVRYDPFTGNTAMHAGLDMAGSHGEPVYAAADGIVATGGRSGAYGNLVELAHGKGLSTRYGHLSAIVVQPGARVRQGQLIGRMGSTGRSTGTHLHYEIRIDGRAVNPRPYLDASAFMLAAQNRGEMQGPQVDATLIAEDDSATFDLAASGQGGMSRIVRN